MLGKEKRLNRLFNSQSKNMILLPLDHGISSGVIKGMENMSEVLQGLIDSKVDSVLLHKGLIKRNYNILNNKDTGLIMHLSASTDLGFSELHKVLVASVDEAIYMGCDAVSMHVNLGNKDEKYMLEDLGKVSNECYKKGMPLIAMMYARDGGNKVDELNIRNIKHTARVAEELGADIIKINYPGSIEEFKEIADSSQVPLVIAGGSKRDELELLKIISDVIQSGARGVSIGRNIFQSNYRDILIESIREIVHKGTSYEEVKEKFLINKEIESNILSYK